MPLLTSIGSVIRARGAIAPAEGVLSNNGSITGEGTLMRRLDTDEDAEPPIVRYQTRLRRLCLAILVSTMTVPVTAQDQTIRN